MCPDAIFQNDKFHYLFLRSSFWGILSDNFLLPWTQLLLFCSLKCFESSVKMLPLWALGSNWEWRKKAFFEKSWILSIKTFSEILSFKMFSSKLIELNCQIWNETSTSSCLIIKQRFKTIIIQNSRNGSQRT